MEHDTPPPPPAGGGSGRKRWLIGIGVVALVLAIGFGAFAASGGLDATGTTTVIDSTGDDGTDTSVDDGTDDDGGGGGNGGLGGAGEPDEDADIADIQTTLEDYQAAYSSQDTDALADLFTPDVFRRGIGAGGACTTTQGLDEVLATYDAQFASGTGTYSLTDTSEGAIDLSGDTASLDTGYTISSGASGSISFELERSGSDWLISRIEASC